MQRTPPAFGRLGPAPDAAFRWVDTEPLVCALGVRQNLTVIVWWTQATGAAVERVARLTREVSAQHGRLSNIHLIRDGALVPTPAARSGFVRMMKDHAEQLANVAVVVGGSGFWASMMRSAITGMRFVSPRTFELRLHADPREIMSWLPQAHLARCGTPLSDAALAELLATAAQTLDAGAVDVLPLPEAAPLTSARVSIGARKPGL
jgi:hypothetical protein